jgi:hypothetical protein
MLGVTWPYLTTSCTCYAAEDAVQIVNSFYLQSHTRNYNQFFLTLCHIYAAYNLTRQYSTLFSRSLHNTLDIFTYSHFTCLSPVETSLVEPLLKTAFLDIPVSLIKPSVVQASLQQRVRWELCCVTRGNAKVTRYSPTPVAGWRHRGMLVRNRNPMLLRDVCAEILFTGRLPSNALLRDPTMGWHVTICNLNSRRNCEVAFAFYLLSHWFLAWLILRPRRWRPYVPLIRQLTFSELHSITYIPQDRTLHNNRCENFKSIDLQQSLEYFSHFNVKCCVSAWLGPRYSSDC